MSYKKNDFAEIDITDYGAEGEGIGHDTDSFTFFVKGAVVGDRVRVRVLKVKPTYCYAKIEDFLVPSPWRTEPVCPVASSCGGCQLQQLTYDKQLLFKQTKVQNCLQRIGGLNSVPMEPIIGMESPWFYRNKAQFPVSRDRDGKLSIGFYASHSHRVVDSHKCFIQSKVMQPVMDTVREFLERYRISIYDEESHKGLVRHVMVRVGFTTGEVMVCLVVNGTILPHANELISLLKNCFHDEETKPGILAHFVSLCLNVNKERTNVILGSELIPLYGEPYITDKIGTMKYIISPLSFYQVNPVQTEQIYNTVREFADLQGDETVWDLYCGIGTIGLYLSPYCKSVQGIEIVPQAIADANQNVKLNGVQNAAFRAGAAEELFPREAEAGGAFADTTQRHVFVVDPPRKGCDEKLLEAIVHVAPEKLIYVSCDPATLARDISYLTANDYEVKRVRCIDEFPNNVHVETVCLLLRK